MRTPSSARGRTAARTLGTLSTDRSMGEEIRSESRDVIRAMHYGLYLVTGRALLPAGKDYLESLDETLRDGHVSVVQIR